MKLLLKCKKDGEYYLKQTKGLKSSQISNSKLINLKIMEFLQI